MQKRIYFLYVFLYKIFFYLSSYNGAQWCYVENNIGYGYSTCTDQRRSVKFSGETWSNHACTTPALYQSACRYCQGRRRGSSNGLRNNVEGQRPRIGASDPKVEGVYTKEAGKGSKIQYQGGRRKYQYRGQA